jgi:hypothetical protein
MVESYIVTVVYLILAVVAWFALYHHPMHIGLKISKKGQNFNYSLNVDTTNTIIADARVNIPNET